MAGKIKKFYFANRLWLLFGAIFLALAALVVIFKFSRVELDYTGDYDTYIETAEWFSGSISSDPPVFRLLKPLAPLLTSIVAKFGGNEHQSFFIQFTVFYLLLAPLSLLLFSSIFKFDLFKSLSATAMFVFGYPIMRYGLSPFTETGAMFFYISGLLLAVWYLRNPSKKIVWLASVISILGFFYKEYSIVSFIIFNLVVLFGRGQSRREKINHLIIFNGLFFLVNLLWQAYVYLNYGYTYIDWYLKGGLSALPIYSLAGVLTAFTMLLLLGWMGVPMGLVKLAQIKGNDKLILILLNTVPLMCLLWGAVDTRLFQVLSPGLICLSVLGIEEMTHKQWLRYISVLAIITTNFLFLVLGMGYIF